MAGPYLLGSSSLRSTNTCMPFVCSGSKLHPKSSNFTPFRNGHLPPATKLTHWTMVLEFGPRVIWAYNRQASRRCFQRRRFHLKKKTLLQLNRDREREKIASTAFFPYILLHWRESYCESCVGNKNSILGVACVVR